MSEHTYISPNYLVPGDTIGIVAPARFIREAELQPAIHLFREWGLTVKLGRNLYGEKDQYSGSDDERAFDLQEMLDDPKVKAVICARGGYGTLRVIDKLDFSLFCLSPKWVVGYSDVTVLHSHIHKLGIQSIHATMPVNFAKDAESVESFYKALFGALPGISWAAHPLNRKGTATHTLVGGNLSLLYALNGSVSDLKTEGKILFLEDLDEYLYHIDRMMLNLKRSGKLEKLAGLVVGGMSEMKDNAVPFGKQAEEIIFDAVKEYDYPVCFGAPVGHTLRNLALVFGRRVKLEVGEESSIAYSDPE